MASPDNQQLWIPYDLNRDCSQRFCSIYCPQWCYIIFPPPPPFDFPDQDSGSKFSPLVIAIIGILAGVFLLVSYYTIIIKNCGNFDALRRRNQRYPDEDLEENRSSLQNEAWHVTTTGLEEALIKSITVCKYKKDGGLVEGTDCSVCLSEFQEDESLRLLPKCSHAFHLPCIDTWLQSHSNCPLCRANIVSTTNPPHLPSPEEFSGDGSSPENQSSEEMGIAVDVYEEAQVELGGNHELEEVSSFKGVSDDDGIIEIRDDEVQEVEQMNRSRVSIADVLGMNSDDDFPVNGYRIPAWSKRCLEEQSRGKMGREDYTNKILHSVRAPVSMKRSFSGRKLLFNRNGRGENGVIPV